MIFLLALLLLASPAAAQHAQPHQHTHEGLVGEFYKTWMIAPQRYISCCNEKDCAPVEITIKDGEYYAVGHFLHPAPVHIPREKLEHNHRDARDSPDGRNHACMSPTGYVYCAVMGSGT